MGSVKVQKDFIIKRKNWFRFWEISEFEVTLGHASYSDAFEEKITRNGTSKTCGMELKDWVIKDLRNQLFTKLPKFPKSYTKSKKLIVSFYTGHGFVKNKIEFYVIDGFIYFESDTVIKRDKRFEKLGI
jgi:hypothetical protein